MEREKLFNSIRERLQLTEPVIATYDSAPEDDFAPMVTAKARVCCFAFFQRWRKGHTLVVRKGNGSFSDPDSGCPGMQTAFGLGGSYPPYMKHFLTDGEGAPKGEGLKATPDLAQQFIDHASTPQLDGETLLLGPIRFDRWESVRSITFFADPDRIAGLLTLSTYFSGPDDVAVAPFSSGCGLMLRELENQEEDRAVIGATDIAMRKYIPAHLLCLTVSPARFDRMINPGEGSFMERSWWGELMETRKQDG